MSPEGVSGRLPRKPVNEEALAKDEGTGHRPREDSQRFEAHAPGGSGRFFPMPARATFAQAPSASRRRGFRFPLPAVKAIKVAGDVFCFWHNGNRGWRPGWHRQCRARTRVRNKKRPGASRGACFFLKKSVSSGVLSLKAPRQSVDDGLVEGRKILRQT